MRASLSPADGTQSVISGACLSHADCKDCSAVSRSSRRILVAEPSPSHNWYTDIATGTRCIYSTGRLSTHGDRHRGYLKDAVLMADDQPRIISKGTAQHFLLDATRTMVRSCSQPHRVVVFVSVVFHRLLAFCLAIDHRIRAPFPPGDSITRTSVQFILQIEHAAILYSATQTRRGELQVIPQ